MPRKYRLLVNCPKCRKPGFLTRRWVRTSYFPEFSNSPYIVEGYLEALDSKSKMTSHFARMGKIHLEKVRIYEFKRAYLENGVTKYEYICTHDPSGNRVGHSRILNKKGKKRIFQVLGPKIIRYYIGHYDSKKYQQNLKKYKNRELKSRPNGRVWCLVKDNISWNDYGTSEMLYKELSRIY